MSNTVVRAATLDYDHVVPLLLGRVSVPGIDLRLRVDADLRTARDNLDLDVVECSLARHLRDRALGDDSWVAIPVGPRRQFCHRAWFVAQDSQIRSFADLDDRPIGISEFPASGNTWARHAAREAGVDVNAKQWVVASFDGSGPRGADTDLPPNVSNLGSDVALLDLLRAGEISAVVCQVAPTGFYQGTSGARRLFDDYVAAEQGYFERTGLFPSHHVMAVRRPWFEDHGDLLPMVVEAFQRSRLQWEKVRLKHGDTSAWSMADIERTMRILGPDWQAYGSQPFRPVAQALAEELFTAGLIDRRIDAADAFADYDAVADAAAAPAVGGAR